MARAGGSFSGNFTTFRPLPGKQARRRLSSPQQSGFADEPRANSRQYNEVFGL
jgi:hypothetical protein